MTLALIALVFVLLVAAQVADLRARRDLHERLDEVSVRLTALTQITQTQDVVVNERIDAVSAVVTRGDMRGLVHRTRLHEGGSRAKLGAITARLHARLKARGVV